jgi:uncharacterized surface protein with fasciclin (FAS1) repeats
MTRWLKAALAATTLSFLAACGGSDEVDIVKTAQSDPQFSILVEAVTAANLGATLSGPGPLTVFAPTNTAFAALLTELGISKEALLADKALLTAVLTYHVVPARVLASEVPIGKAVTTAQGGVFKVDAVNGGLRITDGRNRASTIVRTDIGTSNGIIHAIDKVLLPANRTVVQTAVAQSTATPPQFTVLVEAVVAAGLADTLGSAGPFTVFAPTDAAFTALLAELGVTKAALLADKALLTRVLTYHVVPGRVLKADIVPGTPVTTVQGQTFTVTPALAINDRRGRSANIVSTDVLASNGVIHAIDRVILPSP